MTNKINDGGAAFPRPLGSSPTEKAYRSTEQKGMTYRQWLAGMALQGVVSSGINTCEELVRADVDVAIRYADALIAELEKEKV